MSNNINDILASLRAGVAPTAEAQLQAFDAARAAAIDGDASCAKQLAQLQATVLSNAGVSGVLEAIYRSVPRAPIPTKVSFGALALGLVTPDRHFGAIYDPLRAMLSDPYITEYVVGNDSESSGRITSALLPSEGYQHVARAIRLRYDTDPDQSGADDALETVTFNPEHRNIDLVAATQTATTSELVRGDVTATNAYRFTLPATSTGGVYLHFATREAALSVCVPERALISQDVAAPGELVAGDRTIECVTTLLTSGNLMRKSSSVLGPALPFFEEYVAAMLRGYYKAI